MNYRQSCRVAATAVNQVEAKFAGRQVSVVKWHIWALGLKGVMSVSDISDAPADNRSGNWQLQQIVSQLREARSGEFQQALAAADVDHRNVLPVQCFTQALFGAQFFAGWNNQQKLIRTQPLQRAFAADDNFKSARQFHAQCFVYTGRKVCIVTIATDGQMAQQFFCRARSRQG